MAAIVNNQFNQVTWAEFLSSKTNYFGARCKTSCKAGTIVLCYNLTNKTIVAIATLGVFSENGKVWREHAFLDADIYSGDNARYNKYDICIDKLYVLPTPVSCENVGKMLSMNSTVRTNITKGITGNFVRMFYKSEDEPQILERLRIWISTLPL